MEDSITVQAEKIKKTFWKSVDEILAVLERKKPNTDITKTAIVFMSNAAKIMSSEVHNRALDLYERKLALSKNKNLVKE